MDRSRFIRDSPACVAGLFAAGSARHVLEAADAPDAACPESVKKAAGERDFIDHWTTDLLDAMDTQLDQKTRVKLMEACGRGCFLRHQFKLDLAAKGRGSLEKLIEAYDASFEIWREGTQIHIRYGAVSKGCYCPVVKDRHPKGTDLHCECTRATHEAIFESALGRPVHFDVLESVRRGGKTCHFVATV